MADPMIELGMIASGIRRAQRNKAAVDELIERLRQTPGCQAMKRESVMNIASTRYVGGPPECENDARAILAKLEAISDGIMSNWPDSIDPIQDKP